MSNKKWYAVASGREMGVYDNWEDCKEQVHGYSHNKYKSFDRPDKACDFVDQHSSDGRAAQSFNDKAVAYRNDNGGAASSYQRTDYMEGRNSSIVHERSYTSGRNGDKYFVEKSTRTSWKNN